MPVLDAMVGYVRHPYLGRLSTSKDKQWRRGSMKAVLKSMSVPVIPSCARGWLMVFEAGLWKLRCACGCGIRGDACVEFYFVLGCLHIDRIFPY